MTRKPLTPDKFDALTRATRHARVQVHTHAREADIIWTTKGIASYLGCSPEFVRRTLASEPDSPIRQRGGRMFVYAADLDAFMRSRPNKAA